jgi:hypothetical protein
LKYNQNDYEQTITTEREDQSKEIKQAIPRKRKKEKPITYNPNKMAAKEKNEAVPRKHKKDQPITDTPNKKAANEKNEAVPRKRKKDQPITDTPNKSVQSIEFTKLPKTLAIPNKALDGLFTNPIYPSGETIFNVNELLGDGNCLYRSLSQSKIFVFCWYVSRDPQRFHASAQKST